MEGLVNAKMKELLELSKAGMMRDARYVFYERKRQRPSEAELKKNMQPTTERQLLIRAMCPQLPVSVLQLGRMGRTFPIPTRIQHTCVLDAGGYQRNPSQTSQNMLPGRMGRCFPVESSHAPARVR